MATTSLSALPDIERAPSPNLEASSGKQSVEKEKEKTTSASLKGMFFDALKVYYLTLIFSRTQESYAGTSSCGVVEICGYQQPYV